MVGGKNMIKESKKKIKEDDKIIIRELGRNSKESIDKIAKRCGFSRQKVWRTIKRFEESNTIWGYHAVFDNEKIDTKQYVLLVKRSTKPAKDAIKKIIDLTMHKKGEEIGIDIHCSSYLHGYYDWMFVFTALNIKEAKRFSELLSREYHEMISEVMLLEDIFPIKKCGIVNPDVERIKEFT